MSVSVNKIVVLSLVVCAIYANHLFAQEESISKKMSISIEVGNWQPHSLNDEPSFTSFGAAGATPYYGLAFSIPFWGSTGLRLSLGYWSLRDLNEVETVHSLTIHPVTLDIKYWFIPDYKLSAYVLYGGGVYWGIENDTAPFGRKLRTARGGWGLTLGAGFDVSVYHWVGFGMAFQYHYVHFKEPLGGVDDFSGPRITGMILFTY